ncbi:DNA-binding LacI/PurR family transcriptional regulator [Arthrobacter sp. 1088]|uniref:LacI family DNA-binding transcriptional regulator n=1 Tax=Arthrobacter sp. 1088 TaxID=2817768 RepID=UPI002861D8E2|nr:LacI family DNA-binding transcriptional regulator [Arthrobacter sp. 1088]MDR6686568.1 DNA-binding LacI/PurR family transcriptional regulator [Arthrobacter sp. 1088]
MCWHLDENPPPEQRGQLRHPDLGPGDRLHEGARPKTTFAKPAATVIDRVSMVDVAVRAGVSTQTVSRVANGSRDVHDDTRRRVTAAMNELGYRPNSAARALRRGSFRTIGVITFSLSSLGTMRTLEAIALHAARQDFAITLIPVTAPTQAGIQGAFSRIGELAVDAVIAIMEVHLLEAATATLPPGVRVVVVDPDAGEQYSVVDTDQAGGARKAVKHLLDLGHETVWHVAGPEASFASERRAAAWHAALTDAGRPVPPLLRGDWSADSGYAVGLRLADEPGCTAVFAANDHMALGMLRAFREKGKSVPGDISLVGFDDVPEASSFTPPLTTVHQNFADVGNQCVDNVLQQIRTKTTKRGVTLIPTQLVVRQSTAVPPKAAPPVQNLRSDATHPPEGPIIEQET